VDRNGNPAAITVTGDFDVGGASVIGAVTMTGAVTAGGG